MEKRVLIVVTSHEQLGNTGKRTGAYVSEVAHPYAVFTKAGYEVDFASPKGGEVPLDGVDRKDAVSAAFLDDAAVMKKLHSSLESDAVDGSRYTAVFFAGGHGTMWDFPGDRAIAERAGRIYDRGGVIGAVCHGPAGLVNIRLASGAYLVAGKEVAAFTNDEERAAGLTEVVPFLLADKLIERGALHRPAPNWQRNVVTSERVVTGQNPASAGGVASAMVERLGREP